MQDFDYFLRFLNHGGSIRNLHNGNSFCVYHKSDIGRDAKEIRACNAYIFDKHRVLYNRYGRRFKAMRLYDMAMIAASFAQHNKHQDLERNYLWNAFQTGRPARREKGG